MTPPVDAPDDAVVWESLIASDADFAEILISLANKRRLQQRLRSVRAPRR